jgi:fatty acyl-CoA reductase
LASLPRSEWPTELANLLRNLPRYLRAERRDRGDFIRTFMRRYEGVDEAELRHLVEESIGDALLQRAMPEAIRRIRAHRAAGHRTVLITGTIDLLVEPLAPLFDEVVAGQMHSVGGTWTGYLDRPPLVDEARAAWLRGYAETAGIDLAQSYGYGDSHSDRAWLELVGNPQAVNPDAALYRHAKRKKWRIHTWGAHTRGRLSALSSAVSEPAVGTPLGNPPRRAGVGR